MFSEQIDFDAIGSVEIQGTQHECLNLNVPRSLNEYMRERDNWASCTWMDVPRHSGSGCASSAMRAVNIGSEEAVLISGYYQLLVKACILVGLTHCYDS